jgi:hypothetical protein
MQVIAIGGEEAIGSYILPFPDSADLTIRIVLRLNKEHFQLLVEGSRLTILHRRGLRRKQKSAASRADSRVCVCPRPQRGLLDSDRRHDRILENKSTDPEFHAVCPTTGAFMSIPSPFPQKGSKEGVTGRRQKRKTPIPGSMLQTVVRPNERIQGFLTKGTPMGWRPVVCRLSLRLVSCTNCRVNRVKLRGTSCAVALCPFSAMPVPGVGAPLTALVSP